MPTDRVQAIIELVIIAIVVCYVLYVCGSIVGLLRQIRNELIGMRMDRTREKIVRQ